MKNDYIYIKLYNDKEVKLNVKLKDKCNKVVFEGKTDNLGRIKIPICNNEPYNLIIYSNLTVIKVSLIAKKNRVYHININNKSNGKLITILLMDKNYPNIKIEGGKMTLWQDRQ